MWNTKLIALLAGAGVAAGMAFTAPALAANVGDKVALPEVRLMDGTVLAEGHFKGKPLVIEYWASWCPFCARQNPYIEKLWGQAQGRGLEVLTISIDREESDAADYMRDHKYTFPVAMETPALREVLGKRKVIPTIFVVKADGKIAEIIPGEMFEEDVLDLLEYAPGGSKGK